MSRILRALVVSAVATATAVAISAVIKNRDEIASLGSGVARGQSAPPSQPASQEQPPSIDPLSSEQEQMLISELEQHV